MVQRRAACWITSRYQNRSSVTEILQKLGWETMEERRKEILITMFNNILHWGGAIDGKEPNSSKEKKNTF